MKNIILLVVFVSGIVFMQYIKAQTVDEVINKYVEARGGKEKLAGVKSVYMEGLRQMMGNDIPIKAIIVQDKLFRTDFEFGGTSGFTIVTPTQGWTFIPMRSQKAEAMPDAQVKAAQAQLDIFGPLVDYAAKGNKVELQGKETIDGKEAYKIKLTTKEGREATYYIDTKTNLLIQTKLMAPAMGGGGGNGQPREVITNYSDYKAFDGIMFPQTITNPGSGMNGGSTTFDKIEVNKKIDDTLYKPSEK